MVEYTGPWGDFTLEYEEVGPGLWRVRGGVDCLVPINPEGRRVFLSPLWPDERYYVDVVPDIVVPAGESITMELSLPVFLEVWLENTKLGEFRPRLKRAFVGEPRRGFFAVYVESDRTYQPGMTLRLRVVNPTGETRVMDEVILDPRYLTLFEHEGAWVSELVEVRVEERELRVVHTDQGPGKKLFQGKREPETYARIKKFSRRVANVLMD